MANVQATAAKNSRTDPAVADLFRLVARNSNTLVPLNQSAQTCHTLYCIHSVAGDVTDYRTFAKIVETEIQVFGVQVPLSRMHLDALASIETLAARYAALIARNRPEGPILIGGFSGGAIIALEVAKQLITAGRDVPLLVAFDGAPCNTVAHLSKLHPAYILQLFANFARCIAGGQAREWIRDGLLWRLAFSFFLRPSGVEPVAHGSTFYRNAMRLVTERCGWKADQVTFLRGMIDALSVYRAVPYPGRVLVFETAYQPVLHAPQITRVWRGLTPKPLLHVIKASHSNLFRTQAAVAEMARIIVGEISHCGG